MLNEIIYETARFQNQRILQEEISATRKKEVRSMTFMPGTRSLLGPVSARTATFALPRLFGYLDATGLADDGDADLARVLKLVLNSGS